MLRHNPTQGRLGEQMLALFFYQQFIGTAKPFGMCAQAEVSRFVNKTVLRAVLR